LDERLEPSLFVTHPPYRRLFAFSVSFFGKCHFFGERLFPIMGGWCSHEAGCIGFTQIGALEWPGLPAVSSEEAQKAAFGRQVSPLFLRMSGCQAAQVFSSQEVIPVVN
jgi:hypothetical protein